MANNPQNSTDKNYCESRQSPDESCSENGVKENDDSRASAKIENGTNNEQLTKEGELLPKIRAKLEEVIISKGITNFTTIVSAGSGVGDNFLGFIGKVAIKGLDKDGKPSTWNWIVKTAPTQDLYRKLLKVEVLYDREIYVYEKIFPAFEAFQKEKSVLSPFKHYPPFIFSFMVPYNESFAMEDMKSKGYVMRNRKDPLDYNHVKLVLKAYAKMHAVSYALKEHKPDLFHEIKMNTRDSMITAHSKENASVSINKYMREALDALDPNKHSKVYGKYRQICDKFVDIYHDVVSCPTEYAVIGHGDSWVNNMLWLYDDPLHPITLRDVCLLDFQLSRYGSPACDLSYFIFACTEKSLRDQFYDDMIKLYYYHLCQQLIEMGCDPGRSLPFSVLEEELKRFSIIGLYYTLLVMGIVTKDSEEIPNLREGNKKIDEIEQDWTKKSKYHDEYCRRVTGCLVDFAEKGYFDCYVD